MPNGRAGCQHCVGAMDTCTSSGASKPPARPATPAEALAALKAGNQRHVSGRTVALDYCGLGDRIAETQTPFAAIIGCADSRVSPSLIFDLGLGNIFVSRVAGNSVDVATLGSTEFAVAVLGVVLVMVLGHSNCGAVTAAIDVANGTASFPADEFGVIGQMLEPVIDPVRALPANERTLDGSIAANARAQATRLASAGPIVKRAVESGRLEVVGAVYDIGSGRVELV
jgi:carbonic anhydrase